MKRTILWCLLAVACSAVGAILACRQAAQKPAATGVALTGNCPPGVATATVKANTPVTLFWCEPPTDANGNATMLTGATAILTVNGVTSSTPLTNVTLDSGPYADGLHQWHGTMTLPQTGVYTVNMTVSNSVGTSAPSATPITVTVAAGLTDQ
jgi:hypothetical protein